MRSHWEWFRLITPCLVTLFGTLTMFTLGQMSQHLEEFDARIYTHQTNAELHITRAEFVALTYQLQKVRDEIITTIRNHGSQLGGGR